MTWTFVFLIVLVLCIPGVFRNLLNLLGLFSAGTFAYLAYTGTGIDPDMRFLFAAIALLIGLSSLPKAVQ